MKLETELKKNERVVKFQIWNGDTAVTEVSKDAVVFVDQNGACHRNPRDFDENQLEEVRKVAKAYNAQIVQITTSTMQVQERKVIG